MIRTRDFLAYMLVLFFMISGIGLTVLLQESGQTAEEYEQAALLNATNVPEVAVDSDARLDRSANLTKFRDKIAAGEGDIPEGEPVLYSVDVPATSAAPVETENPDALIAEGDRAPRYCSDLQDHAAVESSWPAGRVTIELLEGARIVRATREVPAAQGTTTVATTSHTVLLQLPVSPSRTWQNNCLDSAVIGVALDGSLIRNDETWRFRSVSHESVIGYARDGFPIYGQGVDESELDACGGYDPGVGYRYHLREGELFVLGCFAGTPQSFLE